DDLLAGEACHDLVSPPAATDIHTLPQCVTAEMTTSHEQARALVWAGGFLIELANDNSLPLAVRQRAVMIARHFPTASEVMLGRRLSERGLEHPQATTRGEEG